MMFGVNILAYVFIFILWKRFPPQKCIEKIKDLGFFVEEKCRVVFITEADAWRESSNNNTAKRWGVENCVSPVSRSKLQMDGMCM